MCDCRYPYYLDESRVKYIGNVDDVEVKEAGVYSVGHSGSYNFYYDGNKRYNPEDNMPDGIVWKCECTWDNYYDFYFDSSI